MCGTRTPSALKTALPIAAAVEIVTERVRRVLTIHNRDSEPCTAAGGAKEQSGEPAPRDQELHIVGHRNRMEPAPTSISAATGACVVSLT